MALLILIVAFYIIYTLIDMNKFNKSEYKQESGLSYFRVRFNMGFYGEYLTFEELRKINGYHKTIVNAYIPKENGGTTEIDVIFLHETGIYVIESKNYSGWIYGNENNKNWTQTFKTGKKGHFYNPIWQNNAHIKHLLPLLNINENYVKSIIAFSQRCSLKAIKITSPNVAVINRDMLIRTIKSYINNSTTIFTKEKIEKMYNTLCRYNHASSEVKNMHINNIKEYKRI